MRPRPSFLALCFLAACGDPKPEPSSEGRIPAGPDPVVVRIPRGGGLVRAYRFATLDSAIWRSSHNAPPTERVLAFDQENGLLAFSDTAGYPGWIDLRLGAVRRPTRASFASVVSADGWSLYGTTTSGSLVRMTPSGDWQSPQSDPIRRAIPAPDGNVVVVARRGGGDMLFRMRPPDDAVSDSMAVGTISRAMVTSVGDRAYLAVGGTLWSVPPADFEGAEEFILGDEVLALAPTPSGDRIFVADASTARLQRLDRYARKVSGSTRLPGLATELRMDPLGRYLLVRPVRGDSAWVVDVGTEAVVGTIPTKWRADLPTVAVDGSVIAWQANDVVFIDPKGSAERRRVGNGANDIWFFARWNGFRPRARGLDQPVAFRSGESAPRRAPAASESVATPVAPAEPPGPPAAGSDQPPPAPPPAPVGRSRWVLSFAAVLSAERAQGLAEQISVNGERPRVSTTAADGTTVYRVIMGPFGSRDEAERAGRASGHTFWVYESGGGT
ncbi:MAG: SPOR domain-containing protein [Gemmatimonadetes bacterium]|nr:SPOR domain-containing protein [Gemmatimonadota bacterium]